MMRRDRYQVIDKCPYFIYCELDSASSRSQVVPGNATWRLCLLEKNEDMAFT